MRRSIPLFLCLLAVLPAAAQQRKMKLDSLGLPPYPNATNVGHISLPLKDILKPKPGEHATGPALTDLAIQTYRVPLNIPVDRIAAFYLKYGQQLGWRLLDDMIDSPTNRSLVFWSPSAPGYLTVEVQPGPNNTRQIDLTRLLGDVNPSRPGEVARFTGKRIREQHVQVTYGGRFLDLKTGKVVQQNLLNVEDRMESGLSPTAAVRAAPLDESYGLVIKVTDSTKHMTSADAYTIGNALVAHAESARPTGSLTMLGKLRATQGLTLRVVVMGAQDEPPQQPAPVPSSALPVGPRPAAAPAKTAPVKPAKPAGRKAAPAKPARAAKPAPTPAAPAAPPRPPIVLTELYGLRPPLTAVPELKRGASNTKSETKTLEKDVELGPSCDAKISTVVQWTGETKDQFSFSPDLFGPSLSRASVGVRTGTIPVEFAQGSGTSNKYTVNQAVSTSTTQVDVGYAFNGQWVPLPGKKLNPVHYEYEVITNNVPIVTKQSTGACPPKTP